MILLFVILLIMFLIISYFIFNKRIEKFQYLMTEDKSGIIPIEFSFTESKDVIISTPIIDQTACETFCRQTPNCVGFNYALNNCSLYRKLVKPPRNRFFRYW